MTEQKSIETIFADQLHKNPFFSTLTKEKILRFVHQARPRNLKDGEIVFEEGVPAKGVYWLESGTVKVVKYASSGKEQTLHFIKAGHTFNEVGGLTPLDNPATVIALEDVRVWVIPKAIITDLLTHDSSFAQNIIHVLAIRLHHTVGLIADLSFRPVNGRLASLILREAEDGIMFRPPWFTQYELASRLGTATDVVRRNLRQMEKDGLIEVERRQIRILDLNGLNALID